MSADFEQPDDNSEEYRPQAEITADKEALLERAKIIAERVTEFGEYAMSLLESAEDSFDEGDTTNFLPTITTALQIFTKIRPLVDIATRIVKLDDEISLEELQTMSSFEDHISQLEFDSGLDDKERDIEF
ncbi:MAG: hypothetical protein Q9M91_06760 [Candidatus Dojkabacteria bacterium]|nr:hypothetical protein [Candidatus Dojkabacteria bacterium]MDQ7021495.1 hypothetical protein [Candidatus Dojkabacteria bacterium]